MSSSTPGKVALAAAWTIALATRAYALAAPFSSDLDGFGGAMFGSAARAYARYGFVALRFAPFVESGPVHSGAPPMLHHPPLLPIVIGPVVKALGQAER